jgi:hypothetical protein
MRGVYAAALLAGLEKDLGSIQTNFDLVCGTSTGGLIALALGAGIPAGDIVKFYEEKGPSIFPKGVRHLGPNALRAAFKKHKYDSRGLEAALKEVFGDKTMADATMRVLVPTVDFVTCKPWVFKTDHSEGLTRDGSVLMREVALATSAAPMFFPISSAEIPANEATHRFVDGGLWANSPVLLGLNEALRFFVGEGKLYGSIRILSVGLPSEGVGNPGKAGYAPLLWKWPTKFFPYVFQLLDLSMTSQVEGAYYTAKQIGDSLPFRCDIKRIVPEALSAAQAKYVKLDGASAQAIGTLVPLGRAKAQHLKMDPEIKLFFSRRTSV